MCVYERERKNFIKKYGKSGVGSHESESQKLWRITKKVCEFYAKKILKLPLVKLVTCLFHINMMEFHGFHRSHSFNVLSLSHARSVFFYVILIEHDTKSAYSGFRNVLMANPNKCMSKSDTNKTEKKKRVCIIKIHAHPPSFHPNLTLLNLYT